MSRSAAGARTRFSVTAMPLSSLRSTAFDGRMLRASRTDGWDSKKAIVMHALEIFSR
jgi:hypothetical protein